MMASFREIFSNIVDCIINEGKGRLFNYVAKISKRPIPGTKVSEGDVPFTIQIAAVDHPFPEEMFEINDLHASALGRRKGEIPGFLGWIGGSYTKGKVDKATGKYLRGHIPSMWIDEVQSDVMQRTHEFFEEKEQRVKATRRRLTRPSREYEEKEEELEQLKVKYKDVTSAQSPLSGALLKKKLEMEQRISELEDEIDKLAREIPDKIMVYRRCPPAGSKFSKFKSKFENYFDRWEDVFYNEAIAYAKKLGCHFMFVIQTRQVVKDIGKEGSPLYTRIYDKKAQEMGMKPFVDPDGNYWWWGEVSKLKMFECKTSAHKKLEEDIEPPERWREHLNTYIRTFLKQAEVNLDDYDKDSYEYSEELKHAFTFWLDEVQEELLSDASWRNQVQRYMQDKYAVDVSDWWGISDEEIQTTEEDLPEEEELSDEEFQAKMHQWIEDVDLSDYED